MARYSFKWPVAFAVPALLLLIAFAVSAPASSEGATSKKKRRRRKNSDSLGVSDKMMPESDYFEEIEASNFMRKVFRSDKDVLLFIYGSQERNSVALHTVAEAAAKFVQSSKAARHFRCARLDELRFGMDLYAGKHKKALEPFQGAFPKMFLVRASEKTPLQIPTRDLQSDMYIVKFLVERSSFRYDFGFHEWSKQEDEKRQEHHGMKIPGKSMPDPADTFSKKSVPRSKHYKELMVEDINHQVFRSDADVAFVIYAEKHKKCEKQWRHFEEAANILTKKDMVGNLEFARLDEFRHGVTNLPRAFRIGTGLPRLYHVRQANRSVTMMDANTIDWYRENGIVEFLQKYVTGDLAWNYPHKKDAPTHEEL